MNFKPNLTILKNKRNLLDFLEVEEDVFDEILAFSDSSTDFNGVEYDLNSEKYSSDNPVFIVHKIPKKNNAYGHRTVYESAFLGNEYKALARRLGIFFSNRLEGFPHDRSFGYLYGRNTRDNAFDHCGKKNLICVDIRDFFPSISISMIEKLFIDTEINRDIVGLLSKFVTINGSLPLGLPTSPIISNAICLPLDVELANLASKFGAIYSRYADDISFSSNSLLPDVEEIDACLLRHGFELAIEKTRKSKIGQAHYVTGLSVSDSRGPHVPRKMKHRLRQELYYAKKFGLREHLGRIGLVNDRQRQINRIDGLVKYVSYHEPRISSKISSDWVEIQKKTRVKISFEPKNQNKKPYSIFIDEAEYKKNDLKILAIAMSVSQKQETIYNETKNIWEEHLSDLWAAGDSKSIARRGIHFADATEDLRGTYIKALRLLPFDGHVAMASFSSSDKYEATYIKLLKSMIKRRLIAAESTLVTFVIEKNSKVRSQKITEIIEECHSELIKTNNRHPVRCEIRFVGKPNFGISVPDFLLGVLGGFLMSKTLDKTKPVPRSMLLFERIRDKYRTILDLDSKIEFSRRKPIIPWSES